MLRCSFTLAYLADDFHNHQKAILDAQKERNEYSIKWGVAERQLKKVSAGKDDLTSDKEDLAAEVKSSTEKIAKHEVDISSLRGELSTANDLLLKRDE